MRLLIYFVSLSRNINLLGLVSRKLITMYFSYVLNYRKVKVG